MYILKSVNHSFTYIGFTNDIERRLTEHNEGLSQSTKYYAPFELEAYVAVRTKEKAIALEKHFKTGSGKAVLKKRILASGQPNEARNGSRAGAQFGSDSSTG